jgi:hypothetical protein
MNAHPLLVAFEQQSLQVGTIGSRLARNPEAVATSKLPEAIGDNGMNDSDE